MNPMIAKIFTYIIPLKKEIIFNQKVGRYFSILCSGRANKVNLHPSLADKNYSYLQKCTQDILTHYQENLEKNQEGVLGYIVGQSNNYVFKKYLGVLQETQMFSVCFYSTTLFQVPTQTVLKKILPGPANREQNRE